MKDVTIKLKILCWHLCEAFTTWKSEVWNKDLNEFYCCNGGSGHWDVCGCGGATVKDIFYPDKVIKK